MMSKPVKEVDPFTIKSSADGFTAKAKNVFDCLQNLEEKHQAYEKARKDNSSGDESDQGLQKDDPSNEDLETITPAFKKPFSSNQKGHPQSSHSRQLNKRGGRMPNFNDGPVKWTKYSLEDVDVLDEASNKQAAYAFLEERRKLREAEIIETKADVLSKACSKGQFTFTKRSKDSMETDETTSLKEDKSGSTLKRKMKLNETETETDDVNTCIDTSINKIEENLDADLQDDNIDNNKMEEKSVVPVFKSRKLGKRNIRSREQKHNDDDNDNDS